MKSMHSVFESNKEIKPNFDFYILNISQIMLCML
jgi:hypothetical protein